jgi:YfiH family protein
VSLTASRPQIPTGVRTISETSAAADFPFFAHPGWRTEFPWLVQGITGRNGLDPFDMGLFGATRTDAAQERWKSLRRFTGLARAVHAHQVHGARVLRHAAGPPGLVVMDAADGHASIETGLLMTVSVADCVPISLIATSPRCAALLHGGWRGVAAGILENGITALHELCGVRVKDLIVHLGPAICGTCYEVGPEVHRALGTGTLDAPEPVDLRAVLARRAEAAGVEPANISVSAHCTRCGSLFHSHRGGAPERQVAVLGLRDDSAG